MADTPDSLADELFEIQLEAEPIGASMIGLRDRDAEVPDISVEAESARRDRLADVHRRAEALDSVADPEARITREVVLFESRTAVDAIESAMWELDVSPLTGPQATILHAVPKVLLGEPGHAHDYLARCSRLGTYLDQAGERLRQGRARDRTPTERNVAVVATQIERYLAAPPEDDPLLSVAAPEGWSEEPRWRDELATVVQEVVRPAMARYRDVLTGEIAPVAREPHRCGIGHTPGGDETYRRAIERHTTTDLGPDEIHAIGLEQIERLDDEWRTIGREVFGLEDPDAVRERVRTDPELRFGSSDEIRAAAEEVVARATEAAPRWFGRLPAVGCDVRVIPDHEASTAPPAYYQPPSAQGDRPGIYWQNTHDPTSRTRVEFEAVAFHESVPGHHLQLALAQELDLPRLRRFGHVTAYGEGWGLYAERLADEMGLYSSPITRLGMLTADAMRACRLVIDTGMHHLGWDRQRAVDYFERHSPMPANDIQTEVDRYIAWPGQALAYLIGRREIDRMRAEASERLGGRFDLAGFHDVVLGSGALPLTVLDEVVAAWEG